MYGFFSLVLWGGGGVMKYGSDKGVLAGFPVSSFADQCTVELHSQASKENQHPALNINTSEKR